MTRAAVSPYAKPCLIHQCLYSSPCVPAAARQKHYSVPVAFEEITWEMSMAPYDSWDQPSQHLPYHLPVLLQSALHGLLPLNPSAWPRPCDQVASLLLLRDSVLGQNNLAAQYFLQY